MISLELHRWFANDKFGYLPYPTILAFLLEKNLIKATSDVEEENVKCVPVGATNISKMGIRYLKPAKPTRSGSQAGSASQTSAPSVSGAGDQEVDSHAGPSRAPRLSAAMKGLVEEMKNELLFKMSDPLMAPLRVECDAAFQQQEQRIQGLEDRLGRVEAKIDLLLSHFQIPQPQPNLPPPPPPNNPSNPPPQNDPPPPSARNNPDTHNSPNHSPPHNTHRSPSPHNTPQNSPSHPNTSHHQNSPNHLQSTT